MGQASNMTGGRDTMKFGLCHIPDYHQELSGSWQDWYEGMIEEVKLAERLGFHGAWFAEHRVPGFAFGSPAILGCSVSLLWLRP
jgi:alkanesulfonate monooxygenase SsuD/methylene tetrahydromethanopterin reductase-like flavin-dependent oxidoreductase (luciferase family)